MTNRLYPEKPGVIPGAPLPLFAELPLATGNKFRRIAAQHAHKAGVQVNCGRLTKLESRLVIGACESHADMDFVPKGRSFVLRMGGAR
jgi:hypothetical protein